EAIRANPMDGVILMAGCDKTTPALLVGAASVDLRSILLSGGPMLNGRHRGGVLGSGTDIWRLSEEARAGVISREEFIAAESGMSRSPGHCTTMGTASTMASMSEALGVTLPGNAAYPAVDARRAKLARLTGRRAVEMVKEDLRLSLLLTRKAFINAVRVNAALGGSTNAVLHLLALAGRVGIEFTLQDWDEAGRDVPTLVNVMPSGKYLMEEFCYAGGVPAVQAEIRDLLDLSVMTANGKTLGENLEGVENFNSDVIRKRDNPIVDNGGIVVLHGNLAPDGAVIKPSAATPALMKHRGKAVVFASMDDYRARID